MEGKLTVSIVSNHREGSIPRYSVRRDSLEIMLGLDMGAKRVGCAKFGLFTKYCQVSPHLQQAYPRRVTFGSIRIYYTKEKRYTG